MQTAATFEGQNDFGSTSIADADISSNAVATGTKLQRRRNIQKYTSNFTTGDAGIPTAGNSDASFNSVARWNNCS
jgi:hypothetical protein